MCVAVISFTYKKKVRQFYTTPPGGIGLEWDEIHNPEKKAKKVVF